MEPEVEIAALERVTAKPVEIKTRAPGYQDPLAPTGSVVERLEFVAPCPVLVDFVEEPRLGCRQLALEYRVTVFSNVEVQMCSRIPDDHLAELRLTHLPRPAHENHPAGKIPLDRSLEVPSLDNS